MRTALAIIARTDDRYGETRGCSTCDEVGERCSDCERYLRAEQRLRPAVVAADPLAGVQIPLFKLQEA